MTTNAGPNIVDSGLVLCVDVANSRSYPGSGTVLTDISGNGSNVNLAGGPTYNSSNNGSLVFDAVDDGFSASFSCNKTYYSLDFWCYPTNIVNYTWAIVFGAGWGEFSMHSDSTGGVYVGTDVASRLAPWRTGVFVANTWQHFTWTFNNGVGKFYKNAVLETSKSMNISAVAQFNGLGTGTGANSPTGRFSTLNIYSNKVLSDSEIIQNFSAIRGRYGV